jgi:hypothetical protein
MTFIAEHSDRFAVALLLRVLNIAESTYYQWLKEADRPCDRCLVDLGLLSNIHEIWEASGRTCGADRVHRQLRRDGIRVGRTRGTADGTTGLAGRVPAAWLARRVDVGSARARTHPTTQSPLIFETLY